MRIVSSPSTVEDTPCHFIPALTGILDDEIMECPQPCWDLVTRIRLMRIVSSSSLLTSILTTLSILNLFLKQFCHSILAGLHDSTGHTGSHLSHCSLGIHRHIGIILLYRVHKLEVLLVLLQLGT